MGKKLKTEKLTKFLLKAIVVVALFFPVITSKMPDPEKEGAFPEFILTNVLVACFIILFFITSVRFKKWNNHFKYFGVLISAILFSYIFFYMRNFNNIQWEWQVINISISFAFLCVLLIFQTDYLFDKGEIIKFAISTIVITNLIGIIVFYKGFLSMHMYNFKPAFIPRDPNFYEVRFNWIYSYKCQYALMLLLFVWVIVTYQDKFRSRITYTISLAILFWALIISHTYTSLAGAMLIVVCDGIDKLITKKKIIKYLLICFFPIGICGSFFLNHMMRERNILTLGGRISIWSASIQKILQNPQGIGNAFSKDLIVVNKATGWNVTNCHNIFLNEMLRFSVPVGAAFTLFIIITLLYAIFKNFSFLRLGIALAFLCASNMDYSILPSELSMVMLMFYCIYFLPLTNIKETAN